MRNRIATLSAVAILGFGAGALTTHGVPSGTPCPPGAGTLRSWEDGSWRLEGCRPTYPCSLPLAQAAGPYPLEEIR